MQRTSRQPSAGITTGSKFLVLDEFDDEDGLEVATFTQQEQGEEDGSTSSWMVPASQADGQATANYEITQDSQPPPAPAPLAPAVWMEFEKFKISNGSSSYLNGNAAAVAAAAPASRPMDQDMRSPVLDDFTLLVREMSFRNEDSHDNQNLDSLALKCLARAHVLRLMLVDRQNDHHFQLWETFLNYLLLPSNKQNYYKWPNPLQKLALYLSQGDCGLLNFDEVNLVLLQAAIATAPKINVSNSTLSNLAGSLVESM